MFIQRKGFSVRNLISLTVVMAAMAIFTSTSEAQFSDGYRFGTGVGFSGGGGFFGARLIPREQPPFFAKFPPVYYNGIVRRPYGISPFAAPPGIAPVELSIPPQITIQNPYFEQNVAPVSNSEALPVIEITDDKVTWYPNPYIETLTQAVR